LAVPWWGVGGLTDIALMQIRPDRPLHGSARPIKMGGDLMSRKVTRRKFMAGTAAGVAAAAFNFPMPAIAQAAPFKLGLLTVKTGPLAQSGIPIEHRILTSLKTKNYT